MEVVGKLHSPATLLVKKDFLVPTWLGSWVSTRSDMVAQEIKISFHIISPIGNRIAKPWLSNSQHNLDTH